MGASQILTLVKDYFGFASLAEFKKEWMALTKEQKNEIKDLVSEADSGR